MFFWEKFRFSLNQPTPCDGRRTDATCSCHTRMRRVCWVASISPAVFVFVPGSIPAENVPIAKCDSLSNVVRPTGSSSPCTDTNVSMKLDVPCAAGGSAYAGAETDDSDSDSRGSDELRRRWPKTGGGFNAASRCAMPNGRLAKRFRCIVILAIMATVTLWGKVSGSGVGACASCGL